MISRWFDSPMDFMFCGFPIAFQSKTFASINVHSVFAYNIKKTNDSMFWAHWFIFTKKNTIEKYKTILLWNENHNNKFPIKDKYEQFYEIFMLIVVFIIIMPSVLLLLFVISILCWFGGLCIDVLWTLKIMNPWKISLNHNST